MQISRFDMLCAQAHWVGSKRRVMQLELQWSLATHCACAHDMSIRPILVEVTMYLGQNRYRKPRCRIVLFLTYKYVNYFIKLSTGRMWCNLMQQNTYIGRLFRACQRHRVWFAGVGGWEGSTHPFVLFDPVLVQYKLALSCMYSHTQPPPFLIQITHCRDSQQAAISLMGKGVSSMFVLRSRYLEVVLYKWQV